MNSHIRSFIASFLIAVSASSAWAELVDCGPYLFDIGGALSAHAKLENGLRADQTLYLLYKNDPLFGAWLENHPQTGGLSEVFRSAPAFRPVAFESGSPLAQATRASRKRIKSLADFFKRNRSAIAETTKVSPRIVDFNRILAGQSFDERFAVFDHRGVAQLLQPIEMATLYLRKGGIDLEIVKTKFIFDVTC